MIRILIILIILIPGVASKLTFQWFSLDCCVIFKYKLVKIVMIFYTVPLWCHLHNTTTTPQPYHNNTTTPQPQPHHNHIKQRHHKGATNTTTTPQPYHNNTTTTTSNNDTTKAPQPHHNHITTTPQRNWYTYNCCWCE